MELPNAEDLEVPDLGHCTVPSPLRDQGGPFIDQEGRVVICSNTRELRPFLESNQTPPAFELAGPRSRLFFDPAGVTCGIVTCGGLCPGVNNVVRSLVLSATYLYGVPRVLGFRYGYAGLAAGGHEPRVLTPPVVESIHREGGTFLGSSRGPQDLGEMVDTLVRHRVNILFTIGGDGTLRGARELSQEIAQRRLPIAVIGIPKTIDNDLVWVERSFGFATAVDEAQKAITAAHCEAKGAWNGIGLVKLMGRHSGFIAAHATMANSDVNFCLVPEVPFDMEGSGGLLAALERRLERSHHAVLVVAEGAGQEMLQDPQHPERDASGNLRLVDVGPFLRDRIKRHLARREIPATIKYIDPSYVIRSLPANAIDSEFCLILGQHAVHAGMSGRTGMVVGHWNRHFTHVPIQLPVARRRELDPRGPVWQSVLQGTGQPSMSARGGDAGPVSTGTGR